MLIDSHCHLDYLQEDIAEVIRRARQEDVQKILSVGTKFNDFAAILKIAEEHPGILVTVGLHPGEKIEQEPEVEDYCELAKHRLVAALGETGLDYYWKDITPELQQQRFVKHITAAKRVSMPLIIHARDAFTDLFAIMTREKVSKVGGVMHCFTGGWDEAKQALDLGLHLSFSGIITFKNADKVREVVKKAPLNRILVETDAPYLAPEPYRGKSNQPAWVKYVAQSVADIRGVGLNKIAKQTSENFLELFSK